MLVEGAVFVDLVDHKDLVAVWAWANKHIQLVAVCALGALELTIVVSHLGLPHDAIRRHAAADRVLGVLDLDLHAVQIDDVRLLVVAGFDLGLRGLCAVVERTGGGRVGLGVHGQADLIARDLRVGHAVELDLLASLGVGQEEAIRAALHGLEAIGHELRQGLGATAEDCRPSAGGRCLFDSRRCFFDNSLLVCRRRKISTRLSGRLHGAGAVQADDLDGLLCGLLARLKRKLGVLRISGEAQD